uniref:Uncharacterized protein n=1 Tax=Arundo donax TaxID=35708 RepID=A0A0A9HMP2_ARUDO
MLATRPKRGQKMILSTPSVTIQVAMDPCSNVPERNILHCRLWKETHLPI